MHARPTSVRLLITLLAVLVPICASAQLPPPPPPPPPPAGPPPPSPPSWLVKLDPVLQQRALLPTGSSLVVARAADAAAIASVATLIAQAGGTLGRELSIIAGRAASVPNAALPSLASNPLVQHLSLDRVVLGSMGRTSATIGATAVRQALGLDGAGVGVAVIDSGVYAAHDDLAGTGHIAQFVDFVNGAPAAYDDFGHGTHVAGIIAGNGFDSGGARSGIAPGAHLVVLKTLDANGGGRISDVIAALDYAVSNRNTFNIRVVNLSVGAAVSESFNADPLTLAAKRAVEAGIVVVAAAGNAGRDAHNHTLYGSIAAPGNAPWVLTVGASSHMGTVVRADDTIAPFSSRGPTTIDNGAKPDLVAPGVGIESLSAPGSTMYTSRSAYLLNGTVSTPYLPYLSLTGTSMAAPVVAGTVALMLQANPALTPNAVKAILQYTAERSAAFGVITQGAGFLNAKGAVELAHYFAAPATAYPSSTGWSKQIIWGTRRAQDGLLRADVNAWSLNVVWGAPTAAGGQEVEWGVICSTLNCDLAGTWSPWRVTTSGSSSQNIVWGTTCGGADCQRAWATSDGDGVVWGTSDRDGVVWGTSDGDGVVWGTSDGDGVVWGTSCEDENCHPVIWPDE